MIFVCRIMCTDPLSDRRPRIDQRLGDAHRFGIGERFVQLVQRVAALADPAPRHRRGVTLQERQRRAGSGGPRIPSSRGSRDACD